jgi:hypothetical protein
MSNVKRITINGTLPYDCDQHPDMMRFLAHLNTPRFGLQLRYSEEPKLIPNSEIKRNMPPTYDFGPPNGKTAVYGFCIAGEEAVSWGWIEALKKAITDCGGTVGKEEAIDLEA